VWSIAARVFLEPADWHMVRSKSAIELAVTFRDVMSMDDIFVNGFDMTNANSTMSQQAQFLGH